MDDWKGVWNRTGMGKLGFWILRFEFGQQGFGEAFG